MSADTGQRERIGLIAGNGVLPRLFAEAAKRQGLEVVAVAHRGETDEGLKSQVSSLSWVRVGQVDGIVSAFRRANVSRAVMAGGIGRVKSLTDARPDLGAVKILARLRSFRDDSLLRAVAGYFESKGIVIEAPTRYLQELLAPEGHLSGPALSEGQREDATLGMEVAGLLGRADVGQTVVVKNRHVLALEAVEGTDETIRRGAKLGGKGVMVVKRCKPEQDERFDLPAVGEGTLTVMREVGATALVLEAGRTLILDGEAFLGAATRLGISVQGLRPDAGRG